MDEKIILYSFTLREIIFTSFPNVRPIWFLSWFQKSESAKKCFRCCCRQKPWF